MLFNEGALRQAQELADQQASLAEKLSDEAKEALELINANAYALKIQRAQEKLTANEQKLEAAQEAHEAARMQDATELDSAHEAKKTRDAAIREMCNAQLAESKAALAAVEDKLIHADSEREKEREKIATEIAACSEELNTLIGRIGIKATVPTSRPVKGLAGADRSTKPTMADVVRGGQRANPGKELSAEETEQAQRAEKLKRLTKLTHTVRVASLGFYVPEERQFGYISLKDADRALEAFGEPGEHIVHSGLAIIAIKQKRPKQPRNVQVRQKLGDIKRRLFSYLPSNLMVYSTAMVNDETVELVVPAEHYAEMCFYLREAGRIVATPDICYATGATDPSQEQTPETTLRRWEAEASKSRSWRGRQWYTEALRVNRHILEELKNASNLEPLAARRLLANRQQQEVLASATLTDDEGFTTIPKRTQSERDSLFSLATRPLRKLRKGTPNAVVPMDMEYPEDVGRVATSNDEFFANTSSSQSQAYGRQAA
ncbi:hypothetical protein GGI20_005445 [Coemansia sp. BCRC 34301]|nr:hypothetical protein GGI20_005445 [Coemansia sp. BCRC 34301]